MRILAFELLLCRVVQRVTLQSAAKLLMLRWKHQVCVDLPEPGGHGGNVVHSSESDDEGTCSWLTCATAEEDARWLCPT